MPPTTDKDTRPSKILIDDPRKCGVGNPETCCIFFIGSADGFECGRVLSIAGALWTRHQLDQMKAQRLPDQEYPACQLEVHDD